MNRWKCALLPSTWTWWTSAAFAGGHEAAGADQVPVAAPCKNCTGAGLDNNQGFSCRSVDGFATAPCRPARQSRSLPPSARPPRRASLGTRRRAHVPVGDWILDASHLGALRAGARTRRERSGARAGSRDAGRDEYQCEVPMLRTLTPQDLRLLGFLALGLVVIGNACATCCCSSGGECARTCALRSRRLMADPGSPASARGIVHTPGLAVVRTARRAGGGIAAVRRGDVSRVLGVGRADLARPVVWELPLIAAWAYLRVCVDCPGG